MNLSDKARGSVVIPAPTNTIRAADAAFVQTGGLM